MWIPTSRWGWFVGDFLRKHRRGSLPWHQGMHLCQRNAQVKVAQGSFFKGTEHHCHWIQSTQHSLRNLYQCNSCQSCSCSVGFANTLLKPHARHKAPVVEKLKSDELLLTYFQHQMILVLAWFGTSNAATLRTWHQWAHPHHWLHPAPCFVSDLGCMRAPGYFSKRRAFPKMGLPITTS